LSPLISVESISNIDFAPTRSRMAPIACASKGAAVNIILAVATKAVGRDLKTGCVFGCMASLASQFCMRSGQRIMGLACMVIMPALPCAGVVTRLATWSRAKATLVKVLMATLACSRNLEARGVLYRMAAFAAQLLMRSSKRIFGLSSMVEAPPAPSIWIVTSYATRIDAETPLMMRVLMTFFASHWRILIGESPMAFFARHGGVQPNQRKMRQIVIEGNFPPVLFAVALLATPTQLFLMRVLLLVT
jgi:hypothetical protein